MATYQIVIPNYHFPLINTLLSRTPKARGRLKNEASAMLKAYAHQCGAKKATGKRRVSLLMQGWARGGRMCDPDAPLKVALDALVRCELLVDDSPGYCQIATPVIIRGKCKQSVITLEDIQE